MIQKVVSLTRKLLHEGIFNHLSDQEITSIHLRVLSVNDDAKHIPGFVKFWRKGDFSSDFRRLQLLQETNLVLQFLGEKMIEEDFLELVID